MPRIHLIFGAPGAGKTTHALKVARDGGGAVFLIDECLKPIAFPASRDSACVAAVLEKMRRCLDEIVPQARDCLVRGRDVVLDIGAFKKEQRDWVRNWGRHVNCEVIMYHVTASASTRRERVLRRNIRKGTTYSFDVPEWVFDWVDKEFEPPADNESVIIISTNATSEGYQK